jgi:beta-glucanase (GH16 family)
MMNKTNFFAIILLLSFISCSNESESGGSNDLEPSDVSLTGIAIGADSNNPNGDGSGIVDFTITATNATSYEVLINEEELELIQNTFSYTFTNVGTNSYTITVMAFNSEGSASATYTITVFVSNNGGPQLVWSDEFDGNGTIDTTKWSYETGGGGWGNNEVQAYTSDQSNVKIENGVLKITAIKENANAATYYFDELNLLDSGDNIVSAIENFDGALPTLNGFDGANAQVIANPNMSGENTTSNVVEFIKTLGSNGNAGVFWDRSSAIDLSVNNKLSLKTWSPETGVVVRLKLENSADGSEFYLVDASTSVSDAWETLTYDFSGAPAYTYDRLVVFFDHGNNLDNYSSGRIKTQNLYDFTYGKVEVRAKLPASTGTWPAIWMLGSNFTSVSWPHCGEMDIMEQKGWDKNNVLGTFHWQDSASDSYAGYGLETEASTSTSEFHLYSLEWTPDVIYVLYDNEIYVTFANNSSLPFDADFFLILNVAMGGNLGGDIDPDFTQDTMEIDYVRVYQ